MKSAAAFGGLRRRLGALIPVRLFPTYLLCVLLLMVIWSYQKQGYNSATAAFSVAGPVAWDSLPLEIRSATTLLHYPFKHMLKTHLFSRSYLTD